MQQIACDVCGVVKDGRAPNWSVATDSQDRGKRKDYCPAHASEADAVRALRAAEVCAFTIEATLGDTLGSCSLGTLGVRLTRLSMALLARGIDDEHTGIVYDQWDSGSFEVAVRHTCSRAERDELVTMITDVLAGKVETSADTGDQMLAPPLDKDIRGVPDVTDDD